MTKHTDQRILVKGIKCLAIALPLLFLSPYFLSLAFLNKENYMFYVGLSIGIVLGALAIWLIFKGLKTFMQAIF
ncbi:MAG: uncharacterized membrane protein YjgN (DUF898 family) [Planctomycetota bacterium]|jgi:hypothetical protein|uniref:DUF6095 family protein n=1 Tax=Patiriisocius sp. Uisw_047 TaxID=3230969 RepID=UPI0039E91073